MDRRETGRLTEPQRVALRLFMERKTAKQIAIELGITPKAVELRLKGARDALGASTSAEAARLLAASEQNSAYRETLGGLSEVADPGLSRSPAFHESESGDVGRDRDRRVLGETRTAFAHQPARLQTGLGWPLPQLGDGRNDLSLGARLLWPFLAICGIGVSIGTLVICGSLLSLAGVAVINLFH
jgi:DNA-binding CsgD family transcriptional regulator